MLRYIYIIFTEGIFGQKWKNRSGTNINTCICSTVMEKVHKHKKHKGK